MFGSGGFVTMMLRLRPFNFNGLTKAIGRNLATPASESLNIGMTNATSEGRVAIETSPWEPSMLIMRYASDFSIFALFGHM